MTFLYLTVFALFSAGIILTLGLGPERMMKDLSRAKAAEPTLRQRILRARGKRRESRLSATLRGLREALDSTGKGGQFAAGCAASVLLFLLGAALAASFGNPFLIPVLALTFAMVPFAFLARTVSYYRTHVAEALESALSCITASYLRTDDLVLAVRENLDYLRPPLQTIFERFLTEGTVIRSGRRECIRNLREQVDNDVFRDWCDALIACEDDRTLKSTLPPIVSKLTDVAIVNRDVRATMKAARTEYVLMAGLVLANLPLLYVLNRDWYAALTDTVAGKAVLALCVAAIVVTGIFAFRFTRPVEYRGGEDR